MGDKRNARKRKPSGKAKAALEEAGAASRGGRQRPKPIPNYLGAPQPSTTEPPGMETVEWDGVDQASLALDILADMAKQPQGTVNAERIRKNIHYSFPETEIEVGSIDESSIDGEEEISDDLSDLTPPPPSPPRPSHKKPTAKIKQAEKRGRKPSEFWYLAVIGP
jgi:hypothetical protein